MDAQNEEKIMDQQPVSNEIVEFDMTSEDSTILPQDLKWRHLALSIQTATTKQIQEASINLLKNYQLGLVSYEWDLWEGRYNFFDNDVN